MVAPASMALLDDLGQEVQLGAGGVLGREFDVVAVALGPLDALDGSADDLFLGHLELEFAMDGAGGEEDVDARLGGVAQGAAQARSMSSALQRARPQMTGPCTWRAIACTASKSPGEAMGKPASITSTPSSLRAWARLQLLGQVHAGAGGLLAVAQRGVEDDQAVGGGRGHETNSGNKTGPGTLGPGAGE